MIKRGDPGRRVGPPKDRLEHRGPACPILSSTPPCSRSGSPPSRSFLDGTRVAQLASDNQVSGSTAYRYLHEGIDVLAVAPPSLHGALLAARTAGHRHVRLDGTLISTDRFRALGPTAGVDLWRSGKHHHHVLGLAHHRHRVELMRRPRAESPESTY